jgi:hypothetical protein
MRQKLEPRIFTESTDFQGLSNLIRRIRENLRFLLVAEIMINAVLRLIIREAFVSMPVADYDLEGAA